MKKNFYYAEIFFFAVINEEKPKKSNWQEEIIDLYQ